MKKISKIFFNYFFYISTSWSSYACDFLNVPIGTNYENLNDRYENWWKPMRMQGR